MLFPLFYAGPAPTPADVLAWDKFMWTGNCDSSVHIPPVRNTQTVAQTLPETNQRDALETNQLKALETNQRDALETNQLKSPETNQRFTQETNQRDASETVAPLPNNPPVGFSKTVKERIVLPVKRKVIETVVPRAPESISRILHTPIHTPPVGISKTFPETDRTKNKKPFSLEGGFGKKSRPTTLLYLMTDRPLPTINEEMTEQLRIAAHFEKNPGLRKLWKTGRHRLFNTDIDEIMSDLMSADVSNKRFQEGRLSCFGRIHTNLALLIAYADFYARSCIVLDEVKKTYVVFGSVDEENPGAYDVWIRFDPVANTLSAAEPRALQGYMEMEDLRRPMKAATHYKKEELCVLVDQMLPLSSTAKTYSKKEMYEALQHHCWGVGTTEAKPTETRLSDYVAGLK
jgi:hypothetical protein